jgi:hypothetical protein
MGNDHAPCGGRRRARNPCHRPVSAPARVHGIGPSRSAQTPLRRGRCGAPPAGFADSGRSVAGQSAKVASGSRCELRVSFATHRAAKPSRNSLSRGPPFRLAERRWEASAQARLAHCHSRHIAQLYIVEESYRASAVSACRKASNGFHVAFDLFLPAGSFLVQGGSPKDLSQPRRSSARF